MNRTLSRIVECRICEREEVTRESLLPDGWMITWEHSITMCDNCLDKWVKRWGEEPGYWLKGGEKELVLL